MPPSKLEGETGWIASFRKRERERKKRRGKEKKSGKIGSLELSRGNQIFEEQKREKGELACSLLFGWKIVIVHGKSVRFSGQSGG